MKSLRPRLNHTSIVAYLALFIALGGVSYGFATGAIDGREVKDETLRSRDLRNNGVRGIDILNGGVRAADVADNSLTGADLNESSLGTVPEATAAGNAASADTLNGFAANQLVRVAASHTADALPSASTNGTLLTTSIVAPVSGFLTIVASAEAIYGVADQQFECTLQIDEAEIADSQRVLQSNGAVGAEENCATNATRQVPAGTHKIDLEGTNAADADFGAAELSVIFTPFNATGGTG